MFAILDTVTGDVLEYESVEEFRRTAVFAFDASAHDAIDKLCDAYMRDWRVGEYEQLLGIKIM